MALVVRLNLGVRPPPPAFAMAKLGTTMLPAVVDDAMRLLVAVIAVAVPLVSVEGGAVIAPELVEVAELSLLTVTRGTPTPPVPVPVATLFPPNWVTFDVTEPAVPVPVMRRFPFVSH